MKYRKIEEQENINLQLKNNKKVQKVKETGITLIALVVTIVLLLILVGVTISQITGENGLIRKAKEAVERYKNATEEEQIQLGQLEQYVSDFSIVGGEEGEKATISIKSLELTGNTAEQQIIVKVTVKGEASGVEYKINSEEEWTAKENEGTEKEGIDGEKETEYTHTFEELEIGKSYYVRVKVYDTNGKYEEAISDVVTLGYIMTAEDKDVLETKTYIGKTGTKSIGSMPNNGEVNETIEVGETYMMEKGYYSGGTITTGTKKIEELEKKIEELENEIKSIKPSSIKANSILMKSGNSELNLGIYNLSKFSNTFNGNFNSYFTYNQTTGEIVCKEDGWYCINLDLSLGNTGNYSRTTLEFFINNTLVEDVWGYCRGDDTYNVNSSSCQVYMIKGDTLKFEKNIEFDACTTSNATIALIKI